ncbi:MAG: hypothetical protein JWM50_1132 [Microbacteriaceae bacterium]|jgi:hypothetical protein|nr:hypothetical protein [Microbacteriaceae bacterium]
MVVPAARAVSGQKGTGSTAVNDTETAVREVDGSVNG